MKSGRIRRWVRSALLLMVACLVGVLSSELRSIFRDDFTQEAYEEYMGLYRGEQGAFLDPPLTLNGVTETAQDTNSDGKEDWWDVRIREGDEFGVWYVLKDLTADGNPDVMRLLIGLSEPRTACTRRDHDGDGRVDEVVVSLGEARSPDSVRYTYKDQNSDGLLDSMTRLCGGQKCSSYLLYEMSWCEILQEEEGENETCVIETRDGRKRVIRVNGFWQLAD